MRPRRLDHRAAAQRSPMIPKEILKRVRRIELRTRNVVNTLLSGEYHSAFKGQGVEFAEVREYQMGDDIRAIDWNVTARMGRPFVKVFEEERELTVMLIVDASSSGEFGSVEQTKNQIAVELCALLAFSAIKNNDRVGLIVFTDQIERFVPPKKGRKHVLRVVRELLTQFEGLNVRSSGSGAGHRRRRPRPIWGGVGCVAALVIAAFIVARMGMPLTGMEWALRGAAGAAGLAISGLIAWASFRPPEPERGHGTDIAVALDFLNRVTTRRGIVFLVSDFQASGFEKPLRAARQRHDMVAITVTDPREVSLKGVGLLSLEDPETGEHVLVDSSDRRFRQFYERNAQGRQTERARLFRSCRVDFVDVWTDRSYVDPLVRFFTARANRF